MYIINVTNINKYISKFTYFCNYYFVSRYVQFTPITPIQELGFNINVFLKINTMSWLISSYN